MIDLLLLWCHFRTISGQRPPVLHWQDQQNRRGKSSQGADQTRRCRVVRTTVSGSDLAPHVVIERVPPGAQCAGVVGRRGADAEIGEVMRVGKGAPGLLRHPHHLEGEQLEGVHHLAHAPRETPQILGAEEHVCL